MINIQNLPKPLTKDERKMLYENWDSESYLVLAERNMRFAIKCANSFFNTGIEDEDLISLAFVGLLKASKKFKPELGYEFLTYAKLVIKTEILQEVRRRKQHPYPDISLNDVFDNNEGEYERGEKIPDKFCLEDKLFCADLKYEIKKILEEKNELKRNVIQMFLQGKTQSDIGNKMGISQSYASRILREFKNEIMIKCGV